MCKTGTQTATTSSSPNPQAMGAYENLLNTAGNVAATPYTPYNAPLVAPVNEQQYAGINNINSNANFAQPYIDAGAGLALAGASPITTAQINQYASPYTQAVVDATQAQFNNQNAIQMQGVKGNAIAQGALGGNREAIAEAETANQQNLAQAPVIAGLENQGYQTGLNTALTEQQAQAAGAYSMGNLGVAGQNAALTGANAQVGAGTLEQQTQQALYSAAYQQFLNQLAYPFQTTQWLAGIDTGVGSQMGGTGTTTQPGPNTGAQWTGLGIAGLGALGQAGGTAGIAGLAPLLAGLWTGSGVERAGGGGVANRHMTIPETHETMMAQQHQLVRGHRRAQMFPHGTKELPLPKGMERLESGGGVFHFNPRHLSAKDIHHHSAAQTENHLLDLGPFSKGEILHRVAGGEIPLAVVERDPHGTEVRAALGTHVTAPHQFEALHRTKSPGHTIHIEDVRSTLGRRMGRMHGGFVPGLDTGGIAPMPYSGGSSFIPTMGITRGQGSPQAPRIGQQPDYAGDAMKAVAGMNKAIKQQPGIGDSKSGTGGPQGVDPGDLSGGNKLGGTFDVGTTMFDPMSSGSALYRRGGAVHPLVGVANHDSIRMPTNYYRGGVVQHFDDGGAAVSDDPYAAPSGYRVATGGDEIPAVVAPGVSVNTGGDGAVISDVPLPRPRPAGIAPQSDVTSLAPDMPSAGVANTPRGIRNNNPGNIEDGPFARSQPGYAGSDGRFAQFKTPDAGTNAAGNLIQSYGGHGINTLSGIINRWAPSSENNTGAYVSAVSKMTGIDPNEKIDMSDPNVRDKIVGAISRYENGSGYASSDEQLPMHSQPTQGVAPPSSGADFSPTSKFWPSLMAMGLGMAASRNPHFAGAMGEGGLRGMAQFGAEQEQEMSQSKIKLEAQKLSQELEMNRQKLAEETRYHNIEAEKPIKWGVDPITMHEIGLMRMGDNKWHKIDINTGHVDPLGSDTPPPPQPSMTPLPSAPAFPTAPTSSIPATPGTSMAGTLPPNVGMAAGGVPDADAAPDPIVDLPGGGDGGAPVAPPVKVADAGSDWAKYAQKVAQPTQERAAAAPGSSLYTPPKDIGEDQLPLHSILVSDTDPNFAPPVPGTDPEVIETYRKAGVPNGTLNRARSIGLGLQPILTASRVSPGSDSALVMRIANEFNPSLDGTVYQNRLRTSNYFNIGTGSSGGNNVTAINTWAQHMNDYLANLKKIDPWELKGAESVRDWATDQGLPFTSKDRRDALAALETDRKAVADEGAKIFAGGSGGALADREEWMNHLPTNVPFHVGLENAKALQHLVEGRLSSLADQYNQGMHSMHADKEFLHPRTRAVMDNILNSTPENFKPIDHYQLKTLSRTGTPTPAGTGAPDPNAAPANPGTPALPEGVPPGSIPGSRRDGTKVWKTPDGQFIPRT